MTLGPLLMVTLLSSGLVLPPPVRPGQDRSYRVGWPPEEPPEQTYTPGTVSSNPLLPQSLVALAPLFLLQFLVTVLRPNSRKMQKAVDNEMILLRWRLLAPSACCIVTLADRPLTPCGLLVALPGCESPVRCLPVRALGLPPLRPLALAAIRPAVVRSLIRFRSNSAKAPKIWKINFPPLVVVQCSL